MAISEQDLEHLRTCVGLAREAYDAGDQPFGTILVGPSGDVLWSDRNHAGAGDETQHPELAVSQWSASLSPADRAASTVYTSGEHCPMCAAAQAWVGIPRVVYASSAQQAEQWLAQLGAPPSPVAALPIAIVAPGLDVAGPCPELAPQVRELHRQSWRPDR